MQGYCELRGPGMISAHTKERILSVARIEEIIGQYVDLKKRGARYVGLCPFHKEKTPSFHVSPDRGIFKCFGCGKGGDVITFLMEHEKFTYPEALRFLADKYHIPVEESSENVADKQHRESMHIVLQFAERYFQQNLHEESEGQTVALPYLRERGIDDSIMHRFRLGYAIRQPDGLTRQARSMNYSLDLLQQAGLVVDRNGQLTDFFHERIIFPVHNLSGKPVAFAGRTVRNDDKLPKYINSPETELYNKGQVLYGLYQARDAIRRLDECFVVEGYVDVLAMHQAGVENTVACSGSALTDEQIRLIKRFTSNVTLLFDGDAAGVKAAMLAVERLAGVDLNIRVVLLPDGHDPDSFYRHMGAEALAAYCQVEKKSFVRFQAQLLLQEAGDDPLKRAEALHHIARTLAQVTDVVRRSLLIQESSNIFHVSEAVLTAYVNKMLRQRMEKRMSAKDPTASKYWSDGRHDAPEVKNSGFHQEQAIVRLMLEHANTVLSNGRTVAAHLVEELKDVPLSVPQYRLIMHETEALLAKGQQPSLQYFLHHEDAQLRHYVQSILASPFELSQNWIDRHQIHVRTPEQNIEREVSAVLYHYRRIKLQQWEEEILNEMRKSTSEEELAYHQRIQREILNQKKKLAGLLGMVILR